MCEIRCKFKEEMEKIEEYWLFIFKQLYVEEEKKKKFLFNEVSYVKYEMEEQYGKLVKRFVDLKNKVIL